ncbi:hypothetical protein GCM10027189_22560 [Rufibacter soli]
MGVWEKAPNGMAIFWSKVALAAPECLQEEVPKLPVRVQMEVKDNATAAGVLFANQSLSKCNPSF